MRIKIVYYFGLLFLFFIYIETLNAMETGSEEKIPKTLSYNKHHSAELLLDQNKSKHDYNLLGLAAGKGDKSAFDILMQEADQKNPYAIFELGNVYIDKGDNLKAAEYLRMSTNFPQLYLHPILTRGFIFHLQGNFSKALHYYRSAERKSAALAYLYKYGNTDFIIHCIRSTLYNTTELKIAREQLIEFAKSDNDLVHKLIELSKDNTEFYSVYMAVVTKTATRKTKKDSLTRERKIPVLQRQENSLSLVNRIKDDQVDPK